METKFCPRFALPDAAELQRISEWLNELCVHANDPEFVLAAPDPDVMQVFRTLSDPKTYQEPEFGSQPPSDDEAEQDAYSSSEDSDPDTRYVVEQIPRIARECSKPQNSATEAALLVMLALIALASFKYILSC